MAIGVGNLGNIIEDFTSSLNQVFGGARGRSSGDKGGSEGALFNSKVGGSVVLQKDKWIGNAGSNKKKARYGFAIYTLREVREQSAPGTPKTGIDTTTYFLDIPPQSIQQKEIFSSEISATRKGVIVESEGVVFRDIIIQGTTGIMPGKRGSSNVPQSNLFTDATSPPTPAQGIDPNTGLSTDPNTKVISGYEEFLRLRQYFLKYASDKVESDGDRFLIFINEKDNQTLIVEPLEFTMTRDSKSPLTYNYRIVLKGIGDLNAIFSADQANQGRAGGFLGFLEDAGNVAANVTATIKQGRAVMNQSTRLLTRISQSIDQTVNGPLRQIQFATEDLKDGVATVLALPEILVRNFNETTATIRENINDVGSQLGLGSFSAATVPLKPKPGESLPSGTVTDREIIAQNFSTTRDVLDRLEGDELIPVPRATLEESRNDLEDLSNNLADFVGLGDPAYDTIKGRISTITPDPLKVVSETEYILLGELTKVSESLNLALASNVMFQSDAELAFENASRPFQSDSIPEEQRLTFTRPSTVREVRIERGDTLERIAQRELGDAVRWIEIVVLNDLKPPYISDTGGDSVRKPGEVILVGDR